MALSPDDRKTFSLKIASADDEILIYTRAKAQLAAEIVKMQKVDDANKNLFDPVNARTNLYQLELSSLDGIGRTTFSESDIQTSAKMTIGNYFFPNNTQLTVPSLSGNQNIWTKPKPYARTFVVGKSYAEANTTVTKEGDLISAVTALIASANSYTPIARTTGMAVEPSGTCSIGIHTTQATCEAATPTPGVWTAGPDVLVTSTALVAIKNNLITAINNLKTFLQTEVTYVVTDDKDSTNQTQNNAAINNINNVIIPALNTWLAYPDFNSTGVNAFNYYSYDVTLLDPTKLYPTELNALSTAISSRTSYIATRVSQLTTTIGSVTQDLNSGDVTSSGIYGKRYGFLILRLDILNGSLCKLTSALVAANAQDSIISSIKANKATYQGVVPTTLLAAPGNDTARVQVVDASFLSVGDTVFVMAEDQIELQRAIKSINGKAIELNDILPAKYKTTNKLRLYKDIT